jgi:serine/threonine protein kinase
MASNHHESNTGLTQGTLLNNRFELIENIGQGGYGVVYSAHDNQNKREK